VLYVLLGFALGVATFVINEWVKDTRKRVALLEVLLWQIEAFKAACEWAAEHNLYDSIQVEKLAEFIQQGYLRQPDLLLTVPRGETRRALSDLYLEVCGTLALLGMYRAELATRSSIGSVRGTEKAHPMRRSLALALRSIFRRTSTHMTRSGCLRSPWRALAAVAVMTLAPGCTTSYVPAEFNFDQPAVPTIDVNGTVTFTNAQSSTDRATVSSYAGMVAEADYHAITEVMVKDASRLLHDNQRSLGGTKSKTIALKVESLQSRYIAFFWKSAIHFTAVLGSGLVISKEVTNAGPDTIRDLNGCIAQGVIQLMNDPAVRAYLSS